MLSHYKSALALLALIAPSTLMAGTTTAYTYDGLGRLVSSSTTGTVNNGAQVTLDYDPADNRKTYVVTGTASKVVVVPLNGLTVIPVPDN